jgi:hypothetical protein
MSFEDSLKAEERELEHRLRRLVPSGHHLQRDSLMFEAGQCAGRRGLRRWQTACTVLFCGFVVMSWHGMDLGTKGDPTVLTQVEAPALVEAPETPVAFSSALISRSETRLLTVPVTGYLALRHRLVMEGGDALPAPPAYRGAPDAVESIADWYRDGGRGNPRRGLFPRLNPRTNGDPT